MPRAERAEAKESRKILLKLITKYNEQALTGYKIAILLCLEEKGVKMPASIEHLEVPEDIPHKHFMVKNASVSKHLRRMEFLGEKNGYPIKHAIADSDAPQDKKVWSLK